MTSVDGLPAVVTDDYLTPELQEYNASSLRAGRAWLLLKPSGPVMWLGPLFRPGVTGCWECLAHRLRQHRAVEAYLQARADHTTQRRRTPSPVDRASIARALVDIERSQLEGAVLTRELATGRVERHPGSRCDRIDASIRSCCSRSRRAFAQTEDIGRSRRKSQWNASSTTSVR